VLDAFAGTGAYGLEALSRGAISATFIESDRAALVALRSNIAACKATQISNLIAADALNPPPGTPHNLAFLDPPYGRNLVALALGALSKANYFSVDTVFIAELGPDDDFTPRNPLAVRQHGKARIIFWSSAQSFFS
jgi:16S rRNA (guanine966-N2)-methyltransferase